MVSGEVQKLRAGARAAQQQDRDKAAALWQKLLDLAPADAEALNALGNWHLAKGRPGESCNFFERAVKADPGQPALLFNLAAAARASGNLPAALQALEDALAADPYFVQAIFQKGILLEEAGQHRAAAQVFRDFLDTAPPEVLGDPRFAAPLERAREAVRRDDEALDQLIGRSASAPSLRAGEALGALVGRNRIFVSEPTFLAVPRLPALPFFSRELTPWIDELEAATGEIRAEALSLMDGDASRGFVPYVANPPGTALNQWRALDHSQSWGAFFFWKHGQRNDSNCSRCPRTAALLERLPLINLNGRAPNAFFSLLAPQTRIPPHNGVTNARSTVHLPLIVPEGCGFRVGTETRQWETGKAWVFDDTIEHEAWNESHQPRLILIFDIWHPMLEPEEQAYFTAALGAYDRHYGRTEGMSDTL